MLTKKIPVYFLLIAVVGISFLAFATYQYAATKNNDSEDLSIIEGGNANCELKIKRLNGFQFIRPIVYAEPICESDNLVKHKSNNNKNPKTWIKNVKQLILDINSDSPSY